MLNLHNEVRGAIRSVNDDTSAVYIASTGFTVDAAGKQTPTYASPTSPFGVQVQAASAEDLRHTEYVNMAGVYRAVYMYGNTQSVVRIDAKGGDLLQFSQMRGGTPQTWKVIKVDETWAVNQGGWSRVIVALQASGP